MLLDSLLATDVTPGQLGSAQRTWLASQLAAASVPTVILVHHTLGRNDGELVDAERLFEVLRPHRHVKAIMFGHSHKYEVTEREGLQLINLPAVGYNFVDSEPVGWVDSVWTDEGVDLTLRSIGGNQAANGQTTSVHWAGRKTGLGTERGRQLLNAVTQRPIAVVPCSSQSQALA